MRITPQIARKGDSRQWKNVALLFPPRTRLPKSFCPGRWPVSRVPAWRWRVQRVTDPGRPSKLPSAAGDPAICACHYTPGARAAKRIPGPCRRRDGQRSFFPHRVSPFPAICGVILLRRSLDAGPDLTSPESPAPPVRVAPGRGIGSGNSGRFSGKEKFNGYPANAHETFPQRKTGPPGRIASYAVSRTQRGHKRPVCEPVGEPLAATVDQPRW